MGSSLNELKNAREPIVSVIVPVYNTETHLDRCIRSIINQNYQNLEIILVDDGSTDKSSKICDSYKKNDHRIITIHQDNLGLSQARNVGIEHSTGEYITFIDADDFVDDEYIRHLVSLSTKYNSGISVVKTIVSKETTKRKLKASSNKHHIKIFDTAEALENMLTEKNFSVSACAKIYSKELFKNIRYPKNKLYEDNGCTYKLIQKCSKVVYSDQPLYHYRIHTNSLTRSPFNIRKMDYIELVDQSCRDISLTYPGLASACVIRRATARFSIIYQILDSSPNSKTKQIKSDLKKFLNKHTVKLIFDKSSNNKIRIETLLLKLNEKLFYYCMKKYKQLKH